MDLVKGSSVLIVVLFHSVIHMYAVTPDGAVSSGWHSFMNVIEPLRMPIFFMVSGMLATSAMGRPWRLSRRRTYGMAYLYILWSAIFFIVVALYIHETPVEAVLNFPRRLLVGSSGYWYLYALLLYFVVAKLLRRWPAWIILAIAIALNLLRAPVAQWNRDFMTSIDVGSAMTSIVTNLVFYILGVYYKEVIAWVADRASWLRVAVVVALVSAYGIWRNSAPEYWEMTYLPISLAWIAAGVMLAHLLVEYNGPRRFGTFFGARTLPIFVVQFPLLMALSSYLRNNRPEYLQIPAVQVVFPILVTFGLVFAALLLYRITQKNLGKYLFEAPRWAIREHRASPSPSGEKEVSSAT